MITLCFADTQITRWFFKRSERGTACTDRAERIYQEVGGSELQFKIIRHGKVVSEGNSLSIVRDYASTHPITNSHTCINPASLAVLFSDDAYLHSAFESIEQIRTMCKAANILGGLFK